MYVKKLISQVPAEKFFRTYVQILNGIMDLSQTEQLLLAELLRYQVGLEQDPFITDNRTKICDELNISTGNFSNYLKKLRDKKALVEREGKFYIHPMLADIQGTKDITIQFEISCQ